MSKNSKKSVSRSRCGLARYSAVVTRLPPSPFVLSRQSASLMLPPPTLAKRPKRAAKEQAQAALGHQDPLESDTSDDGARSPAPAPPQPAASCSKATKTPRGPKTAKLAYNSLPTALHDLVDKPIYESDKVTKDPYSAIAALEIHNMVGRPRLRVVFK